jgi:hypothetical protein
MHTNGVRSFDLFHFCVFLFVQYLNFLVLFLSMTIESRDWTYIISKGGAIQYYVNRQTNLFIISILHSFIASPSGQLSLTGFFVRDNGDATSCLHHFWPKVQTKSSSFVVKGYWRFNVFDLYLCEIFVIEKCF